MRSPRTMQSVATSYDLRETYSKNATNRSRSSISSDFTSLGLESKNLQARVPDFHVPLYSLRPIMAQASTCRARSFCSVP